MISVVTGTLDRLDYLKKVIGNTVLSSDKLELVLVDGGSTDGTIEYLKELNHPRIKFINFGKRSYYWHYMNLGIENSSHEWVCQWNDDVILENNWDDIIEVIKTDTKDFYIFSWREPTGNYVIYETEDQFVMNFGIYNKRIFKEIGMYNPSYKYYCCDGDMSFRAREFGYTSKKLYEIKCRPLTSYVEKKAAWENYDSEIANYHFNLDLYRRKILPDGIVKLV